MSSTVTSLLSTTDLHAVCRSPGCCGLPPAGRCIAGPSGQPRWTAPSLQPAAPGRHRQRGWCRCSEPSGSPHEPPGNVTVNSWIFFFFFFFFFFRDFCTYTYLNYSIKCSVNEKCWFVVDFDSTDQVRRGAVQGFVQSSRSQQGRINQIWTAGGREHINTYKSKHERLSCISFKGIVCHFGKYLDNMFIYFLAEGCMRRKILLTSIW